MPHGERKLAQHVTGAGAGNRHPQNSVLARNRQDLDEPFVGIVGDGTVEFGEVVARDLVCDALFARLGLAQADVGDLGIGVDDRREHCRVRLPGLEAAEQRVHRRKPGVLARCVRELQAPDDVPGSVNGRHARPQPAVDHEPAVFKKAEVFQAIAAGAWPAADRDEDAVEGELPSIRQMREPRRAVAGKRADGDAGNDRYPVRSERGAHHFAGVFVLAGNKPWQGFDDGRLASEPGEALRKLAANGTAAEDKQASRPLGQSPQRFGGQRFDVRQARYRRHGWFGTSCEHDSPPSQLPSLDIDGPRIDKPRVPLDDIDAQLAIALRRIMRGDARDHLLDPAHDRRKIRLQPAVEAETFGMHSLFHELGGPDQCL